MKLKPCSIKKNITLFSSNGILHRLLDVKSNSCLFSGCAQKLDVLHAGLGLPVLDGGPCVHVQREPTGHRDSIEDGLGLHKDNANLLEGAAVGLGIEKVDGERRHGVCHGKHDKVLVANLGKSDGADFGNQEAVVPG